MKIKYELRTCQGKRVARGSRKELRARLAAEMPDGRYVLRGPHYHANYLRQNGTLFGDTACPIMYSALPHVIVANGLDRPYPTVSMGVNASYDHIDEVTRYMYATTVEGQTPFLFSTHGVDTDPREVWQIPEAARLCERLVASSFISLLVVSTADKDMARQASVTMQDGWGSFEIWAVTKGLFHDHRLDYTPQDLMNFVQTLMATNRICDDLVQTTP